MVKKTFLLGEGGIGGVSLDSDANEVFLSYNDSGTVTGGFPVLDSSKNQVVVSKMFAIFAANLGNDTIFLVFFGGRS